MQPGVLLRWGQLSGGVSKIIFRNFLSFIPSLGLSSCPFPSELNELLITAMKNVAS